MKKILCIVLLLLILHTSSSAQYWYKTYASTAASPYDVETYDKGFLISAYGPIFFNPVIYKTDVNGNVIWKRYIGNLVDSSDIGGICNTADGGIAILGQIERQIIYQNQFETDWDLDYYLLKLNACGEKEWCKIYRCASLDGSLCQVQQLKDGSFDFYAAISGLKSGYNTIICRVDNTGNIIWQHYSLMTPQNMIIDSNGNSLVTGYIDMPYQDTAQNLFWYHSNMVKTDTSGKVIFDSRYDLKKHIQSTGRASQSTRDGGYLTVGARNEVAPDPEIIAIRLIKNDSNGNGLWDKILLIDSTRDEGAYDMCRASDSTYIIIGQQSDKVETLSTLRLLIEKVDYKGNLLKRVLYNNTMVPEKINNTSDGKFIIAGSEANFGDAVALKINSDLGIDSEYNVNYTYDYLCTHTVKAIDTFQIKGSDTVHLTIPDTNLSAISRVINSIKSDFSLYPNPAVQQVSISASGLHFGSVQCNIYDMLGNTVKAYVLYSGPFGSLNKEIDVSNYAKGVYFIEIAQGEKRFTQKLVVE